MMRAVESNPKGKKYKTGGDLVDRNATNSGGISSSSMSMVNQDEADARLKSQIRKMKK